MDKRKKLRKCQYLSWYSGWTTGYFHRWVDTNSFDDKIDDTNTKALVENENGTVELVNISEFRFII